jgi:integrase
MTWSEQQKIELHAPVYLRNVIQIVTETGLRVYKELACMRKDEVDLANKLIFVDDSKTPTGVAEVPLTDIAVEAFRSQIAVAGPGQWLFPNPKSPTGYQQSFKKTWETSLRRAGVSVFPALRSPLDARDPSQRWWCGRRVGNPDASPS